MSACPPDAGFFPLVYDELRRLAAAKLAGEPAGHSLDATALVHEAYLRLGGGAFADRSMFMRAAAVAEVARHRLCAGLSIDETAEAMGISRATAFHQCA